MFHVKQGNWFKSRGKCAIISNIRKIGKDPEGCRNMGRIIAITNQKGGVGKTTTAVNLSAALGQLGKRVLLIDIDPQGNATSGLGVNKRDIPSSTYDLIIAAADVKDVIRKTPYENVDILPSNIELAGAEIELVELDHRESRLKRAIAPVVEQYDYILIDCPPSLGLITLNGLTACGSILVPIQCEYYALEGLSQLIATVRQVKRLYNPRIEIEGVLLTMYDARLNLTVQVVQEVKKYFADKVYATAIPRNVRLSEAPSFGQPVAYFDRSSKGAKAYEELAKEILEQHRQ
jgi:chromosome partitioning protein